MGVDLGAASIRITAADEASKVFSKVGKALTVTLAAAGAATVALTKKVIENYGEYEQLVGGVETLFKDSASVVEEYAKNAYKTAQMSANEYMSLTTDFSASLLQSLGGDTAAAAKVADTAISDMADNANKMGTSMESVENAYKGFAKQNYTMLDNLKLGYGGTKSEMERLIADANKVKEANGEMANLSIDSFADIVEAIHTVQDEMGITGTTAQEATQTIEGSIGMMKSTWDNLMTGLGDSNANISELCNNFVESFGYVLDNVLPIIQQIAQALPQAIETLAGSIGEIVATILPPLMDAVVSLVTSICGMIPTLIPSFVEALLNLISGLIENLPTIIAALVEGLIQLVQGLCDALPDIIRMVGQAIIESLPIIIEGIAQLIQSLAEALPEIIKAIIDILPDLIVTIVSAICDNLPIIIQGIVDIIIGLVDALPDLIMAIIDILPTLVTKIVTALIESLPILIEGAIKLVIGIVTHLPEIIMGLIKAIPDIVVQIASTIGENLPKIMTEIFTFMGDLLGNIFEWLWGLLGDIGEWFGNLFGDIFGWLGDIIGGIGEWFGNLFSEIGSWVWDIISNIGEAFGQAWDIGSNLVKGLWDGISDCASWLWDNISGWCSDIWDGITGWFGIHSPSTKMAFIGEMMTEGMAEGIEDNADAASDAAAQMNEELAEEITAYFSALVDWSNDIIGAIGEAFGQSEVLGYNLIVGLWNGINDNAGWLKTAVMSFVSELLTGIKDELGIHSPSTKMEFIGEMLLKGMAKGIEDNTDTAVKAAKQMNKEITDTFSELQDAAPEVEYKGFVNSVSSSSLASINAANGIAGGNVAAASDSYNITLNIGSVRSDEDINTITNELEKLRRKNFRVGGIVA